MEEASANRVDIFILGGYDFGTRTSAKSFLQDGVIIDGNLSPKNSDRYQR